MTLIPVVTALNDMTLYRLSLHLTHNSLFPIIFMEMSFFKSTTTLRRVGLIVDSERVYVYLSQSTQRAQRIKVFLLRLT